MLLGHRVGDGDKILVLHIFNNDGMLMVSGFRFQWEQGNAAAADHCIAGAADYISADGTDIEFTP